MRQKAQPPCPGPKRCLIRLSLALPLRQRRHAVREAQVARRRRAAPQAGRLVRRTRRPRPLGQRPRGRRRGQRRPDRSVPRHRPGGRRGRVTDSPTSSRDAGWNGPDLPGIRVSHRLPTAACVPEDRARGQAVENATRHAGALRPRQTTPASRCPVLPGTLLRSIAVALATSQAPPEQGLHDPFRLIFEWD